jgi:hypothetical protein
MKTSAPDPLDEILAEWSVDPALDEGFRRSVWRRIAADIDDLPWADRLLAWWLRPGRLALTTASVVLLGAFVGVLKADFDNSRARASYFSSINPMDQQHQALHQFATR